MTVFGGTVSAFVAELDSAIDAHLAWTRRVLRCAVLRTFPGDDVMALDAHCRCRFGQWFTQHRETFEEVDADVASRVFDEHLEMHDAVRALCSDLMAARRGSACDLDLFEARQSALVADLAYLKTEVLARSARFDPLTDLPLRYGLEEEFTRYRALARRNAHELVVMMADVDRFKRVNDAHGHAAGDRALRHVASILRAHARADEPVFRYGGEEFLVLFNAVDAAAAGHAADRLLQALRDAPLELSDGTTLQLRISAGLAIVGPEESMATAVERADAAMYAAKHAGRDRWLWGAG